MYAQRRPSMRAGASARNYLRTAIARTATSLVRSQGAQANNRGARLLNRPPAAQRNRGAMAMRGEKKVIDINTTSFAVETTGTQLQLLNGCAPGSQNFNRIGRKITMKSLQIRGRVQFKDTTGGPTQVRMIVVYDKQPNGAAPTFANIISSQNIAGTIDSLISCFPNLDNRDRFEIIRDRMYESGVIQDTATQAYAAGMPLCTISEFIPLGARDTQFNAGTAGTIGDITSGSLYVFFISNQANANGVDVLCAFRTRFTDM